MIAIFSKIVMVSALCRILSKLSQTVNKLLKLHYNYLPDLLRLVPRFNFSSFSFQIGLDLVGGRDLLEMQNTNFLHLLLLRCPAIMIRLSNVLVNAKMKDTLLSSQYDYHLLLPKYDYHLLLPKQNYLVFTKSSFSVLLTEL